MQIWTSKPLNNIDSITNTDLEKDDCPCAELVKIIEIKTKFSQSFTTLQTLGILWLYCDIHKSIEYFEAALKEKPSDENTNFILFTLKKKLTEISN